MKSKLKTMVGTDIWEFEFDSTTMAEFWESATTLTSFPKKCGNDGCGSNDLQFIHRTPKGYSYYSIDCKACGYGLKYGQHQEGGGFFAKSWEAPYTGENDMTHPGGFAEQGQ